MHIDIHYLNSIFCVFPTGHWVVTQVSEVFFGHQQVSIVFFGVSMLTLLPLGWWRCWCRGAAARFWRRVYRCAAPSRGVTL